VTNWPTRRSVPAIVATDEDLIAGSIAWHEIAPYPPGTAEWDKWLGDFRAWCAARGTDPVELVRLRVAVKLAGCRP
jgi:hypothetical protein